MRKLSNGLQNLKQWCLAKAAFLEKGGSLAHLSQLMLVENANKPASTRSATRKIWLLLLNRNTYQEVIETYPIAAVGEIKKILANKYANTLYYADIGPLQNSERTVHLALPYTEYYNLCRNTVFVLPISWALARTSQPGLTCYQSAQEPFYLLKTSYASWQTLVPGPLVASTEQACQFMGAPANTPVFQISKAQFLATAKQRIISLLPLLRLNLPAVNTSNNPAPLIKMLGLTVVAYLALSSLYLQLVDKRYQQELVSLSGQANAAMALRDAISQQHDKIAFIQQHKSTLPKEIAVWSALVQSKEQAVSVLRLSSDFDNFMLNARVENAPAYVEKRLQSTYLHSPEFTAPVQRVQQHEIIQVSFKLNAATLVAADAMPDDTPTPLADTEE